MYVCAVCVPLTQCVGADEKLLLLYGAWLCYKARSTTWIERYQFSAAVWVELIVHALALNLRYWYVQ
jgi:hypothetical protein